MGLDKGSKEVGNYCDDAKDWSNYLSVEHPPLGLQLKKSDSLVNMIQSELDRQASKEKGGCTRSDSYHNALDTTSPKAILKPSHFHASILRIGTWERKSMYDGDLVAKFYYANNKLIWEIITGGLKSKIEIDWETISALKVNFQEGEPGTLEIMLSQVPIFWRETNPQPRMSTRWRRATDFTNGQASIYRMHFLQCAPGILDEHIVKLLSSNPRLYLLSMENTINQMNPLFEQFHSEHKGAESAGSVQNLHCYYNYPQFEQHQFGEPVSMPVEANTVRRNHNESQDTMQFFIPSSVQVSNRHMMMPCSGDLQFNRGMFTCNYSSSSQTLPNPQLDAWNNGMMMNDDLAHYMINPSMPARQNLLTSMGGASASNNVVSPADVRNFIREIRLSNQPINSGTPSFYYDDSNLNQNTREIVGASNYAFNGSSSQPAGNGDASYFTAASLDEISRDLLMNDTYSMEATDAVDEGMIMSRVDSFSDLLLQDPAPPTVTVQAAGDPPVNNIEAEAPPPQVLDVAPPGNSGGEGDNSLQLASPQMENAPWEHEPEWNIDMDMEFLLDLLPFTP